MSIHHELRPDAGAAGVTVRLAEALRSRGHHVDLLSFDDVGLPGNLPAYAFPWYVARTVLGRPNYDVLDLSSGDGWVLAALRRLIPMRAETALVTRSHGLEHTYHEALLARSKQGNLRLSWKYPIYHGGFRLWECRMSFALADAALFLNETELDYAVKRLGVKHSRAHRIPNGIGGAFVNTAERLTAAECCARQPSNLAFVGSYLERKGVEELRGAMISVLRHFPDAKLSYFGVAADPDAILVTYPAELRTRVSVVSRYRNEDLPNLLADQHILVFPSWFEGFPLTPLEAMACGLVPIVADIPGPTEYIKDGHNGIVVPSHQAVELERGIAGLLQEPDRWAALRTAAIATAKDHSWEKIAISMEAIYDAAIQEGR
ncbi:glycosyltransferase family 4 protein [Paracraurococcus lichenis]|uniref:Glycosyltransferase family 4 protein n=1 Tax=Paracraurococcus lichenis TaxID=3064888 RepID=A0ABT9ECM7_9PROT|nr:glycosyltransferase family 4 protein [Paracraurococcus sp. LOR1-02]MDO9713964.1 glycosyltransferase family 4 protein [Paracraurococcus sp. LOR1-02]